MLSENCIAYVLLGEWRKSLLFIDWYIFIWGTILWYCCCCCFCVLYHKWPAQRVMPSQNWWRYVLFKCVLQDGVFLPDAWLWNGLHSWLFGKRIPRTSEAPASIRGMISSQLDIKVHLFVFISLSVRLASCYEQKYILKCYQLIWMIEWMNQWMIEWINEWLNE